jgi:predicted phosphodiesterase
VTTTGVVVSFVTDSPVVGKVFYGPDRPLAQQVSDTAPQRYHHLAITGLAPNTRCYYRVQSPGIRPLTHAFFTAAPPGEPFRFAMFGDNRTQPEEHAKVVDAILSYHPRFLVNSGDLVAKGADEKLWDTFFGIEGALLASTPLYPALGNHEGEASIYFRLFSLPGKERYYSFDYGDVHFVVLDSNRPYLTSKEQRDWLLADLRDNQQRPFIVVVLHNPLYTVTTTAKRQKETKGIRAVLEPLLLKYRVDLVVSGHDHAYEHNVVNGRQYIVSGGGGAPLYAVKPKRFTVKAVSTYHFLAIEVRPGQMEIRAVTPEGRELDRLVLNSVVSPTP